MLYQCSGYSRLVCGGCHRAEKHEKAEGCHTSYYCSIAQERIHCEPVEEEGDE